MFFLKPKHKSDELLPPPPPFPTMELEEEKQGSEISKKAIKQAKVALAKKTPIKKIAPIKEIKEKKPIKLKEILPLKQAKLFKKIKPKGLMKIVPIKSIPIKKITPIKQIKLPIKKIKEKIQIPLKKIKISKKTIKKAAKPKEIKPRLEEDFGLNDIEFELPKELEKNVELPETLEDFDVEDVGKEFGIERLGKELEQESKKPKEILEAEEEIKSAIEKIKENPSLFNRLFAKREKEKPEEIHSIPEIDDVYVIQSDIKKAREALMKFDLEAAKMNYIEIMRLYSKIKPEEQAKVYHDIKNLYFERKSAEELKV